MRENGGQASNGRQRIAGKKAGRALSPFSHDHPPNLSLPPPPTPAPIPIKNTQGSGVGAGGIGGGGWDSERTPAAARRAQSRLLPSSSALYPQGPHRTFGEGGAGGGPVAGRVAATGTGGSAGGRGGGGELGGGKRRLQAERLGSRCDTTRML